MKILASPKLRQRSAEFVCGLLLLGHSRPPQLVGPWQMAVSLTQPPSRGPHAFSAFP